jgi:hypothetical protein
MANNTSPTPREMKCPCPFCKETAFLRKQQNGRYLGRLFLECPHCETRAFGHGPTKLVCELGTGYGNGKVVLEHMTRSEFRKLQDEHTPRRKPF